MAQCINPRPIVVKGERYIVPCNKCNFCLQDRRNAWAFRLYHESRKATTAKFITLTYDQENIPLIEEKFTYMTLRKEHLNQFHENLRKANERMIDREALDDHDRKHLQQEYKMKYYSVGEYGTKFHRPHYHSIMFNVHPRVYSKLRAGEIWTKGRIHLGNVNEKSISYTTKYVIDKADIWEDNPAERPFAVMSKGLGLTYLGKKPGTNSQAIALKKCDTS